MARRYIIQKGSFRMPDGSERTAGQDIELDDDVATAHAHLLQAAPEDAEEAAADPVQTPALPAEGGAAE